VSTGATLGGTGTIKGPLLVSGHLAPGDGGPGIIRSPQYGITFFDGGSLDVELNGTTVGTQYDQESGGSVFFNGIATLNVALGFTPAPGDTFTIIQSPGVNFGKFSGLPEGKVFTVTNGPFTATFQITYQGGAHGTSFVLTALDPANPILRGIPATNDAFVVKRNGGNDEISLNGTLIWSMPVASLSTLTIDGAGSNAGGGADVLKVDSSAGNPFPSGASFQAQVWLADGSRGDFVNGRPRGSLAVTTSHIGGNIDLTGVNLTRLGTVARNGDQFTIVNNALASGTARHINGARETFSGPGGALSGLFQITYHGGDGNDVVLTAVDPANPALQGTPGDDLWLVRRNTSKLDITLNGTLIASPNYSGLTRLSISGARQHTLVDNSDNATLSQESPLTAAFPQPRVTSSSLPAAASFPLPTTTPITRLAP
jgi:hypothetical protein